MENNKSEFKATGVYFDGARVYEIQVSRSGDAARYRMTVKYRVRDSEVTRVRDSEVTRGRWQEIRYSKRNGYAYITMYGKRIYLHKFQRIY